MAGKPDVYTRVTETIVEALEAGVKPWHKPWNAEHAAGKITRPLRGTGEAYQGINVLMLWSEAFDKGYSAPIWMTFRQAKELNATVRKGEKGTMVVYANKLTVKETNDETGEDEERKIPFMKAYTVFNVEQIDGLPEHFYASAEGPKIEASERLSIAEAFITATGADIQHGGNRAFYTLDQDRIRLPHFEFFEDPQSYYSTAIHELTHWTRHPSRLDRDLGRKKWGDEGYAMEELVAELGSAFLCADLGITPETREDHAAYIDNWLRVLKQDKRAIFNAAAHAQRAADYLHDLQSEPPVAKPEPSASQAPEPAAQEQSGQLLFSLE
ncbi:MAG: DUF1738 domain-containing protein [Verrucomicrobiae bacterium]|nr:DUF1738 domain-containing protein [Verrucomicrobiae bacterium]